MKPEQIVKAHQYLYYVKGTPVISDRVYDSFCDERGIFGGGGSDREQDYSEEDKHLASRLLRGEAIEED